MRRFDDVAAWHPGVPITVLGPYQILIPLTRDFLVTPFNGRLFDSSRAPLIDHLMELRKRLMWSVIAVIAAVVAAYLATRG